VPRPACSHLNWVRGGTARRGLALRSLDLIRCAQMGKRGATQWSSTCTFGLVPLHSISISDRRVSLRKMSFALLRSESSITYR
jgi:hypothetical protein